MWRLLRLCCSCWWTSSIILPAFVLLWADCHPGKFRAPSQVHAMRFSLTLVLLLFCGIAVTKCVADRSTELSLLQWLNILLVTGWKYLVLTRHQLARTGEPTANCQRCKTQVAIGAVYSWVTCSNPHICHSKPNVTVQALFSPAVSFLAELTSASLI